LLSPEAARAHAPSPYCVAEADVSETAVVVSATRGSVGPGRTAVVIVVEVVIYLVMTRRSASLNEASLSLSPASDDPLITPERSPDVRPSPLDSVRAESLLDWPHLTAR